MKDLMMVQQSKAKQAKPEALKVDVKQTRILHQFKHGSPLISCRFDPTGRYVYFGAQDYRVWRWQVGTKNKVELNHDTWVRAIAFSGDGKSVITGGYDGQLIWWPNEGEKLRPQRVVAAHDGWIRAVSVSPDGNVVATVGNDLLVKLWNAADGSPLRSMPGHERHIYQVAFHPDGKQLATGDLMGNLFAWDAKSGELIRKLHVTALHKYDKTFKADIGGFRDLRFNDDGTLLACAGITNVSNAFAGVGNPLIEVWDWAAGKQKTQLLSKAKLRGVAWGVLFHQQMVVAASGGGGGGHLLFWKTDGKEQFHQLKLPNTARDLDISPNGLYLATAHHDGHLRIYTMAAKS